MHSDPEQTAHLMAFQELVKRDLTFYLYDKSTTGMIVVDAATSKVVAANPRASYMFGQSLRQLINQRPTELLSSASARRWDLIAKALKQRASHKLSFVLRSIVSGVASFRLAVTFVDSSTPSFVITFDDISREIGAKAAATRAQTRLTSAIEALSDGFVLYDSDDRLVLCNETYRTIYADSAPAMVPGTRFEDILRYGLERGQYLDAIGREEDWLRERLIAHEKLSGDVEQPLSDGRWLRIVERTTPDGGRVGLRVDITDLKAQQVALREMALTDELTGLRNRRDLESEIANLAKHIGNDERLCLVHLDLNRFKRVNDVHGHSAGDHVLRTCAKRLRNQTPKPKCVARMGGDEFLLVFATKAANNDIKIWGNRLVEDLARPIRFADQDCCIGANVGMSFLARAGQDASAAALNAADIALNRSGVEGRDSVTIFEAHMRDEVIRDASLSEDMRRGLQTDEFVPFYQPQVNSETGEIVGFEALIRWTPTGRPPVPADEFLRIAQDAGMTEALDDIVMVHACAAVRQLIDWGLPDPKISINLSMEQVSDPRLVDRLEKQMSRYGVKHCHLRIELLESTLLDERTTNIIRNVHAMIAAGFQMELDDFGTGHAAIATLRTFDVSRIKIDRSFVRDIDIDSSLQTITGAIVDLARNLGISVLAEGVETNEEQDVLLRMGCSIAQGYLHARPMALQDLHAFLTERGAIAARH